MNRVKPQDLKERYAVSYWGIYNFFCASESTMKLFQARRIDLNGWRKITSFIGSVLVIMVQAKVFTFFSFYFLKYIDISFNCIIP